MPDASRRTNVGRVALTGNRLPDTYPRPLVLSRNFTPILSAIRRPCSLITSPSICESPDTLLDLHVLRPFDPRQDRRDSFRRGAKELEIVAEYLDRQKA